MFCEKCGSEVSNNDEFCQSCGAPVAKETKKAGFSIDKLKFEKGKSNIIALVACVIMLIMVFLPYVTIEVWGMKESTSLISATDGVYFIILAIGGAVAALMGEKKTMTIIGGIACALALFEMIDFSNAVKEVAAYGLDDAVKKGLGYWLMILSSVGLLAAPFVEKFLPKNK